MRDQEEVPGTFFVISRDCSSLFVRGTDYLLAHTIIGAQSSGGLMQVVNQARVRHKNFFTGSETAPLLRGPAAEKMLLCCCPLGL